MKVLQIHDFVAPGNSRSGLDMCRELIKRGHEVHVMAGVGPLGPSDGAQHEGITFHTYPHGSGRGALAYLSYCRKMNREVFERTLRSFDPDVLFFMQPLCTNGVMRSPSARSRRRAYHFFSPWAREWEINSGSNGGLWSALNTSYRRRSEARALKSVGRVMCASQYMRSQLLEQHPEIPHDRITILHGAVDAQQFQPAGRPGERFTVFTMRRLVRRMGVDLLIDAAAAMPDIRLIIGGDGPERAALQARAGPNVEFVGYVPDSELPRRYSEADLVVLPTRELEGFGLVLIEAMACGTPAMGTRIGGIPEVLEPLDERLLVAPTVDAIAAAIDRYRRDADWRRSLRSRCRDYVVERFSWERIAPVLVEALS